MHVLMARPHTSCLATMRICSLCSVTESSLCEKLNQRGRVPGLPAQGLQKDVDLQGHVMLAQMHTAGWLPVPLLATARAVQAWFRECCPTAAQDPLTATACLRQCLAAALPYGKPPCFPQGSVLAFDTTSETLPTFTRYASVSGTEEHSRV